MILGETTIGECISEVSEKTTENNQYPILTSSQSGIVSQEEYFNKQVASKDNTGYKIIRKGQFTYRAMSDTGRFYINRLTSHDIGIVSPAYPVFEIRNDSPILPEYLLWFFRSELFQTCVADLSTGSTRVSLKLPSICGIKINIISKDEQKKIVTTLETIDRLIEQCHKHISDLDVFMMAKFNEMFCDDQYEIVKASDVCDFITKGTTPAKGEIFDEYRENAIPYLKVYNLSFTGELLFDQESQYIDKSVHDGKLARSKVYPNDVLMNIVGPPLGKFSLVTDEFDEWNINQAVAIFRAKERILPRFLLAALMQPKIMRPFIEQAVGVRQLNISLEQCRNLSFPLPSIDEQQEFVDFSEKIYVSKENTNRLLGNLEILRKTKLQEYFN